MKDNIEEIIVKHAIKNMEKDMSIFGFVDDSDNADRCADEFIKKAIEDEIPEEYFEYFYEENFEKISTSVTEYMDKKYKKFNIKNRYDDVDESYVGAWVRDDEGAKCFKEALLLID